MNITIEDLLTTEWMLVTSDMCVSLKPCFLIDAILTSDGGGAATCVIKNGHSTNAPVAIPMRVVTSGTRPLGLKRPVYLSQGLFVDVGSNVGGVFVQFFTPSAKPSE